MGAIGTDKILLSGSGPARAWIGTVGNRGVLAAHRHDNPYLSIYLTGSYREETEAGVAIIDRLGFALHPAGAIHTDEIGPQGLDALIVEFDYTWFMRRLPLFCAQRRSRYWLGGAIGRRAISVSHAWLVAEPEANVIVATMEFLADAMGTDTSSPPPDWLTGHGNMNGAALARDLAMHPAWIARAYARYRGESLREATRRRRVGRAASLLRETPDGLADIAAACGFTDQSHMNRGFMAIYGRPPGDLRRLWRA